MYHTTRRIVLHVLLTFVLSGAALGDATNLCVPDQAAGFGGLGGLPTIDGRVNDEPGALNTDVGWDGATRINLGEYHGSTRSATMMLGRATTGTAAIAPNGSLYMSFVISTPLVSANNLIVLGFSPQTDPAHDWRIHIKPLPPGVDTTPLTDFDNQPANTITFWRNSNDFATGNSPQTPTPLNGDWLLSNIKVRKRSSVWSVEVQIPLTNLAGAGGNAGIYLPTTSPDTFKIYVNVLSTNTLATPAVLQDPWPFNQPICPGTTCDADLDYFVTHKTPAISNWGTGSLFSRSQCAGISLAWSDIGVQDPNNSANIISDMRRHSGPFPGGCAAQVGPSGLPNTFIARPLNSGAAPAQISATFRIANWGIGGANFDPLPPPGNPTPPTQVVSVGPAAPDRSITTVWDLTKQQSCEYAVHPHQCIHVDLDSPDLSVVFENKSVERNMDFVPASTFSRKAFISGDQGPLPVGATRHRFLIAIETDQHGLQPSSGNGNSSDQTGVHTTQQFRQFRSAQILQVLPNAPGSSFATWIARGMVYTDGRLIIDDTVYQIVQNVGDFGYVAKHDEAVTEWAYRFSGDGLQRLRDDLYLIDVAPGTEAVVETTISANETRGGSGRWRAFIDAGINFPDASALDGGFSINAGIERRYNNNWSIEGILGYHRFDGEFQERPFDVDAWQLSLNGKYFFGSGALRPFVNGGVGAYRIDPPDDIEFGMNVGAGLLYEINSKWGLEGVYNYHSTDPLDWSTLQLGLRWHF